MVLKTYFDSFEVKRCGDDCGKDQHPPQRFNTTTFAVRYAQGAMKKGLQRHRDGFGKINAILLNKKYADTKCGKNYFIQDVSNSSTNEAGSGSNKTSKIPQTPQVIREHRSLDQQYDMLFFDNEACEHGVERMPIDSENTITCGTVGRRAFDREVYVFRGDKS